VSDHKGALASALTVVCGISNKVRVAPNDEKIFSFDEQKNRKI
jgi:hypothetical protein